MAYSGTAAQRLTAVRAQIDAIITGGAQEYGIRGRMLRRANLLDLRKIEKELQREANLETQGQAASLGMIVRPS